MSGQSRGELAFYVCTADAPLTPERARPFGGRVAHPDAKFTHSTPGEWPDGADYDHYKCPNCGESFDEQVPQ